MTNHVLKTDGGARGNPGPAATGGVLYYGADEVARFSRYLGEATNNVAEYSALIEGLQLAIDNDVTDLECLLDSELIVKQLNGEYRVKDSTLKVLHAEVRDLSSSFSTVSFVHIPRAKNTVADGLVNKELDAAS